MASSSLISTTNHKWTYDVFVNFGGENIIKNFVDHLLSDFKRKGIRAFGDDEQLRIGEEKSRQVYRAIEQSRFLVVVFSKNFASSPWCLRKLVKILECKEKEQDKYQVCTVFYNVKPEMVLSQIDSHEASFSKHETFDEKEVPLWMEALTKAANLHGWDLEDLAQGYESKFIDIISKHIFSELNDGPLHVGENLVGVHSRAEQMNLLHFAESSKVHMIGICGVPGIGKTSIAKAVYNRLYVHFDGCSFCEDVKGFVKKHGMTQLQRQIIEDVTKADIKIRNVGEGSSVMKRIMASKQVLVILDGVDQLDQLEALAGAHCWFGPGSLIVVTGEDRQLLLGHWVQKIYDVELLHDDEALELLSLYAFKQKHPNENFRGLSDKVVQHVKGHPLALKVLGCFLFGKTVGEWESELDRLESYPIDDMQGLISRYSSKKKQKIKLVYLVESISKSPDMRVRCRFSRSLCDVFNIVEETGVGCLVLDLYGLKIQIRKALARMSNLQLLKDFMMLKFMVLSYPSSNLKKTAYFIGFHINKESTMRRLCKFDRGSSIRQNTYETSLEFECVKREPADKTVCIICRSEHP